MRHVRPIGKIAATVCLLAASFMGSFSPRSTSDAHASETPTFYVMNTSETMPDGVYFRNSPDINDTKRVPGLGVYEGEQVQLQCYTFGDAVGPYSDRLWYYVLNTSRETNDGAPNVGMLNAHYINDGQNANIVDSGVLSCVNNLPPSQTEPVPSPASVAGFFAPFNLGQRGRDHKVEDLGDQSGIYTAYFSSWVAHPCPVVGTNPYFALHSQLTPGQYYDRVGGWSAGRLGPEYLIQGMETYDPTQLRELDYIILIDPGNYGDDLSGCDVKNSAGTLFASWLEYNTSAHLVILSGTRTQENNSQGIQQVYFNPLRAQAAGTTIRSRVLVCNYDMDHYKIYDAGQYWIKHVIDATSCPTLNYEGTRWSPTPWHP